jgi:hypothetical protein
MKSCMIHVQCHSPYINTHWYLNDLFTTLSNTCSCEFSHTGMTTISVFVEVITAFISGVKRTLKDQKSTCPVISGASWAIFHNTANQTFIRRLDLTHCFPLQNHMISFIHSLHWHVQNSMIPCRSQELLPFLSVMYIFLPPFSTNYSYIPSHLIVPSLSWSTSQSSYIILFWGFYFLPFSVHVQTNVIYLTLLSLL